jgi:hypothetical protein
MDTVPTDISAETSPATQIIPSDQVKTAWRWFVSELHPRPNILPGESCVYDQKRWGREVPEILLKDNPDVVEKLAILYIASQLAGSAVDILRIIEEKSSIGVSIYTQILDPDVRSVIENVKRFRHSLSECLPFWVQLATIVQSGGFTKFALSLPNFHPEDKGPDGMSLALDAERNSSIEIRSAKSSIKDPYYLVASAEFREGGDAQKNKLLEEFYLISTMGYGFTRLDRLLSDLCQTMGYSADQQLRAGLLGNQKSYNAFVIADDQYSSYEMFSCYHRVSDIPNKCVATYIGSDEWIQFAERVRERVIAFLDNTGMW